MFETAVDNVSIMRRRLAVARFGEMDRAKWWNTKGLLSDIGASRCRYPVNGYQLLCEISVMGF
jgi:hypothetical protein